MNRKTFCISFFLRRVRTVKGMAPILARITVNGISKEVYTQCRTPVDKWDTAKGRATGRDKLAYEVNAYIVDFRAKVVEIYRTLQAEGFEGNVLEIKERLQSPGNQAKMFLEELTLYCEKRQKEVGVRITQLTSNKYYRLCRYLRELHQTGVQKRRYSPVGCFLWLSRRLQYLFTDRPPLPPQWRDQYLGLSAQFHALLPAKRVDREKSV